MVAHSSPLPAIELKGNLFTLMVLRVLSTDLEQINVQLAHKVAQAPQLLGQAPLVLDLLAIADQDLDLNALVQAIRQQHLIPVAVRNASPTQQQMAIDLSLGILPNHSRPERVRVTETTSATNTTHEELIAPDLAPASIGPTKIITQPVRSGQQIVALQGDLIILAAVSPGAEILAHRHIHVYGRLRGRALAGVNGDKDARIFCQHLDAELVAIAGHYQINEELPEPLRGKAVQIALDQQRLVIQPLEAVLR
jgi:septum site-determining protein MinC